MKIIVTKAIYIAGPMTGYPEFNFPAFFTAEEKLTKEGYKVFNPADKKQEKELEDNGSYATGDAALAISQGFDFRKAYMWDLEKVVKGNGIYMLNGWEQSPGARGEHAAAVAMKKHYPNYEIRYQ
jgi:hypothetical protein